jgi:hypothetical protein
MELRIQFRLVAFFPFVLVFGFCLVANLIIWFFFPDWFRFPTRHIGDPTCRYNALSPLLRCAVKPSGPCRCQHYQARETGPCQTFTPMRERSL